MSTLLKRLYIATHHSIQLMKQTKTGSYLIFSFFFVRQRCRSGQAGASIISTEILNKKNCSGGWDSKLFCKEDLTYCSKSSSLHFHYNCIVFL